jgi:hypothetical protein
MVEDRESLELSEVRVAAIAYQGRSRPMITEQPVNNHDDMRKVTESILRDAGMTIAESGGEVTFAGKEPVRKNVIKAGATTSCVLAANAVADAAIWKERTGEGQDIHVDLCKAWIDAIARSTVASPSVSAQGEVRPPKADPSLTARAHSVLGLPSPCRRAGRARR